MTYTARFPTTAFILFKIASSVLEESGFGFCGCICSRTKTLEQPHAMTQYLDPCSLASDKRASPVNDHIFLINDVSLNKSHAVLLSCSLVQYFSFPSLDS